MNAMDRMQLKRAKVGIAVSMINIMQRFEDNPNGPQTAQEEADEYANMSFLVSLEAFVVSKTHFVAQPPRVMLRLTVDINSFARDSDLLVRST